MRICIDCRQPCAQSPCAACRSARNRRRDAKRGTPAQRGYDAVYLRHRERILHGNPYCYWCGVRPATTADHVIPLTDGGGNEINNLVPSCYQCNYGRTSNIWRTKETN